ncbi:30S ribosomal protein S16 [Streptomyces sp. HNM0574]|uniref:30S ribosomal protein S16 n=1 Tax=Streptomyces sp. HNM0574 TaxID=2714954 RepID=UPI00146AE037|nr:30S ribosomal protein S16 [Streptomyces sp. HNM0574]
MAVKIKLKRLGKIRSPHYRIIVADSRTRRDGRAIEEIGLYHPVQNPSRIELDSERVQYWLGVGAQPTEPVEAILKVTGDWQKFKGLPAPEPMKTAEPKPDYSTLFESVSKAAGDEPKGEAITQKAKKADKKADEAEAESTESTEA